MARVALKRLPVLVDTRVSCRGMEKRAGRGALPATRAHARSEQPPTCSPMSAAPRCAARGCCSASASAQCPTHAPVLTALTARASSQPCSPSSAKARRGSRRAAAAGRREGVRCAMAAQSTTPSPAAMTRATRRPSQREVGEDSAACRAAKTPRRHREAMRRGSSSGVGLGVLPAASL